MAARTAAVTWRPTAPSLRNLAGFWTAVAVTGTTVSVARAAPDGRRVIGAALLLALTVGALAALVWNRPRFTRALAGATSPKLANWPPTAKQAEAARVAARADLRKVIGVGSGLGALAGLVPVFGAGVAAAGMAGAAGTYLVARAVRAHEEREGVVVLTAGRQGKERRRDVVLAVVPDRVRARRSGGRARAAQA